MSLRATLGFVRSIACGDKLDRVSVNPYCRTKVPQVGDLVAEGMPGALGSARRPQLAGRMPVQSPS
jgi:hypothetical protein